MKDVYNIDVTYTTENIPGDITIEPNGSWTVIEQYADTLNAFQHAYYSAKLSYEHGKLCVTNNHFMCYITIRNIGWVLMEHLKIYFSADFWLCDYN